MSNADEIGRTQTRTSALSDAPTYDVRENAGDGDVEDGEV